MKKILSILFYLFINTSILSQNVDFIEYDLDNGLHVILHQDKSVPLAVTSVMYHVGSKDDSPDRTGFAHFFEHLLFEGSENIGRGEFDKIVNSNGGTSNAYTSNDETYYFEFFPSNKLELGLWLESERMLHPVIDEAGVKTQNEVVKEEKRTNYDNACEIADVHRRWSILCKTCRYNLETLHNADEGLFCSSEDFNSEYIEE